MKETYIKPEIEIESYEAVDVISTSIVSETTTNPHSTKPVPF